MPTLEEMRLWLAGDSETTYGESLEARNKLDLKKMRDKKGEAGSSPPEGVCFVCEGSGIQATSGDACRLCKGTGNAEPSPPGGVDLERMAASSGKKYSLSRDGRDAVLLFGKHKGDSISELAKSISGKGYLRWILEKDFDAELHEIIKLYDIETKRKK